MIQNPQLDGESFFWAGGPVGVLLSHGFSATTTEVRLLGYYLQSRGYTVSGPLLPGHGVTPEALNACTWPEWVAALEKAYQVLCERCQTVFVGGESMGGLLALQTALQHPEMAGVMVYAPAFRTASRLSGLAPFLAPFIPFFTPEPSEAPLSMVDERWKGYTVRPLRAMAQLLQLQKVVQRQMPALKVPLLVVQGRLDKTIDPLSSEHYYQVAGSNIKEFHWLDRSSHCLLLDCEWETAAELSLKFIEQRLKAMEK